MAGPARSVVTRPSRSGGQIGCLSSWPSLTRGSRLGRHLAPKQDGRVIGERSDAVLRTAMPGHDQLPTSVNRLIFRPTRNANWFYQQPENKDLVLFYEYYHGDSAMGMGASHQTGWSSLIAALINQNFPVS